MFKSDQENKLSLYFFYFSHKLNIVTKNASEVEEESL